MELPQDIRIEAVNESAWDEFFRYINDHRSDNGTEAAGYFLPLSRSESLSPYEREPSFRDGLKIPVGAPGWRRAWAARTATGKIVGHVDLRSHAAPNTGHRCLLGMGVGRHHRRLGLGAALLEHAIRWARQDAGLDWLDLEVVSSNEPALRLYLRAGFVKLGEVPEMFQVDGRSLSFTTMAKHLRAP